MTAVPSEREEKRVANEFSGMSFVGWPEAFQAGAGIAGGKGWNLARLDRYGFSIPAGGILTVECYLDFILENGLKEAVERVTRRVTIDNVGEPAFQHKLASVRQRITGGRVSPIIEGELRSKLGALGILGKPLAVRSSAVAEDTGKSSFAGILDSFLNVHGLDNVLSAVRGCYASLWTPRAVAYRLKMNIGAGEAALAVVIMAMVETWAAGIGFTCDPRTGREDVLIINANFGLGESVVSGAVQPDEYRLDRELQIREKRIGRKEGRTELKRDGGTRFTEAAGLSGRQVLSDEDIRRLGLLIRRVQSSIGGTDRHQDVEWVFDGKDFFLVQARPVTALPRYTYVQIRDQPDMWSNANFRDAVPMVQSTLNWSLNGKLLDTMPCAALRTAGYPLPPGIPMAKLFQGRAYLNLAVFQWVHYDALGVLPRLANQVLGGHQPEIKIREKKPYAGIKGCQRLSRVLKAIYVGGRIRKTADRWFSSIDSLTKELRREDLKSRSETDLIARINKIGGVLESFAPVYMFCTSPMPYPPERALERSFPGRGKAVANALMAGVGRITSAEQGYRLVELAEKARIDAAARQFLEGESFNPLIWEKAIPETSPFKESFRDFLEQYGHRGIYETDIINPRWREDPSYLLNIITSTLETADSAWIRDRQKETVTQARREVCERVPFYRRMLVNRLLRQDLKLAELREMCRSTFAKLLEAQRMACLEIGRRLAARGILGESVDIFHCSWCEVLSVLEGYWDGRGLDVLVVDRKAVRAEMEAMSPPDLVINEVPSFVDAVTLKSSNELVGLGVAAGKASGPATLVRHPREAAKLQAEDVLVAPSTDPGWTPLFLKASAIVMETGGFLSHGAIVAREYGVPAVANISGVMKLLEDGQLITVDGDRGKLILPKRQDGQL